MSNSYNSLNEKYNEFQKVPENANKSWFQDRGRKFEKLLNDLFNIEDLEPRTNYRPQGQEIDGSFYYDGKFFILEAKWQKKPISGTQILTFKGKVNGKLIGTLGVFISISGYSKNAINSVTLGQGLNTILFDQDDFKWSLNSEHGFKKVLNFKLRTAAEKGLIYTPYSSENIEYSEKTEEEPIVENVPITQQIKKGKENILIICEGQTDELIIKIILNRLHIVNKSIRIMKMYGSPNIILSVNSKKNKSFLILFKAFQKIIIIEDSDNKKELKNKFFQHLLKKSPIPFEIVIPDPSLEIWLKPTAKEPRKEIRFEAEKINSSIVLLIKNLARTIDLNELYASKDGSFKLFKDFIES